LFLCGLLLLLLVIPSKAISRHHCPYINRHVSIDVVSGAFEGKSSMERQRMVYKAIWLELQETVHAVDNMSTKTPAEMAK
jgi:stress-induced morphogen